MKEIQDFIEDKEGLKALVRKTKETDSFYLEKRSIKPKYNPLEKYNFDSWIQYFTDDVKVRYESLHKHLLYGDEKQNFKEAIETFKAIGCLFIEIDE